MEPFCAGAASLGAGLELAAGAVRPAASPCADDATCGVSPSSFAATSEKKGCVSADSMAGGELYFLSTYDRFLHSDRRLAMLMVPQH